MDKDSEITNTIVSKTYTDPNTGKFIKGNPGGARPKGSRDFNTDFDEVVDEIAKENGMTKSEARKVLLKVAFKEAKNGNYSFYKDIHDRVYGRAKDSLDITSAGRPLPILGLHVPNNISNEEDSEAVEAD
jgi:hypothetical protein